VTKRMRLGIGEAIVLDPKAAYEYLNCIVYLTCGKVPTKPLDFDQSIAPDPKKSGCFTTVGAGTSTFSSEAAQ